MIPFHGRHAAPLLASLAYGGDGELVEDPRQSRDNFPAYGIRGPKNRGNIVNTPDVMENSNHTKLEFINSDLGATE